jgi:TolB-like protein/DNA-binding winged helix-turn-helix (wHTH) protein/Tfp pilus assembly protein PilF
LAAPSSPRPDSIYRFASFELDASSGELRKHGYRVPLQDQPFRILCLLLDRPTELITREEIREALWAADTFVDFDRSLNKAMVKLRQALDDDADAPRFIQTLPKRGYRFSMAVEVSSTGVGANGRASDGSTAVSGPEYRAAGDIGGDGVDGGNDAARDPEHVTAIPRDGRLRRVIPWVSRSLATLACIGIVLWLMPMKWRDQLMPPIFRTPIRSLAVLPLDNFSGDPAQDYFADGMTDDLTTSLARIQSLRVVSRSTMNQYRKSPRPIPQIAHELNVDAVIEGSVVRWGDKVRITVQLIDARHDRHLWAQSYERQLTSILEVQDAIAMDVASQVQTSVGTLAHGSAIARAAPRAPIRPNAYDDFLHGRDEMNKQSVHAIRKAAEYFQQAIDDDPQYARAYAGLADAYALLANYRGLLPSEAYPLARAAAAKALELDPDLPEAHGSLALVRHHYDWDWKGAEVEYKRSIELQPNYAPAYHRYAWFLSDIGRHDEAIREIRRAQELDPSSIVVATNVGRTLYQARDYDEAIIELQKALEMDPDRIYTHIFLGMAYDAKHMCSQALNEFRIVQTFTGGIDGAAAVHAFATCGLIAESHRTLALIANLNIDPIHDWFFVAGDFAALGDKDRAFEWLEIAFQKRDFFLTEIKGHPYMDPLRSDLRFQHLLERMKFPE